MYRLLGGRGMGKTGIVTRLVATGADYRDPKKSATAVEDEDIGKHLVGLAYLGAARVASEAHCARLLLSIITHSRQLVIDLDVAKR